MNESIGIKEAFSYRKLPLMTVDRIIKILLGNHNSNNQFSQNFSVGATISGLMLNED